MITTFYGYLETAYLVTSYMAGVGVAVIPSQIEFKIEATKKTFAQVDQKIEDTKPNLVQIDQKVSGNLFTGNAQLDQRVEATKTNLLQLDQKLVKEKAIQGQLERKKQTAYELMTQVEHRIESDKLINLQLLAELEKTRPIHSQLEQKITNKPRSIRSEVDRGWIRHEHCSGYLEFPYMVEGYLVDKICAHLFTQLDLKIADKKEINTQLEARLEKTKVFHTEIEQRIEALKAINTQIKRVNAYKLNTQLTIAIYNTTNLRILYEFPSRGTSGTNWSVIGGGTASGDFNINNVNTDLVEQAYRSTATTITIQCDTQISQGIFNDTLAILNHNLTRSATVQMLASNSVTFATVGLNVNLNVETENMYWISPNLPFNSYRYWRLQISDVTNTDGYIQLGTIIFGSSIIFSGECFVDEVTRRKTHFADRIRTEGFSSVSNDRALKRAVSLTFRRLNYNYDNYPNLIKVIDTTRTSLKALWIPTPQFASRFAVFGKLSEIPVENHKVISEDADYIDLDINVDEAL